MSAVNNAKVRGQPILEIALLLLVLVAPLFHLRALQEQTETPKAALAGLAGLLLCALAAVFGLGRETRRPLALGLFLAFTLWQFAVAPFALSLETALGSLLLALESAAFLLVAWWLLERPWTRSALLASVSISCCVAAVYGLAQYEAVEPGAFPGGLSGVLDRLRAWNFLFAFLEPLDQTDRPGSFFGHANVAAEFVSIGALITWTAFLKVLLCGPRRPRDLLLALVAGLLFSLMALFVLRSGSRAVLGSVALGAVLVWAHLVVAGARRRPVLGRSLAHLAIHLALALALGATVFVAVGGLKTSPRSGQETVSVVDRMKSAFDSESTTVRERLDLWTNTLEMIKDRPVFGTGPGNFRIAYPEYADRNRQHALGRYGLRRQPARPHNEYLAAFAESGLVGGLLLLFFISAVLLPVVFRFSALRRQEAREEGVALAALAGMLAILGCALFAFPLQQTATRIAFLSLAALLLRSIPDRPSLELQRSRFGPTVALAAIAVLLVSAAHHRAAFKASADLRRVSSVSEDRALGPLEVDRALDQALARAPWRIDLQLLRSQFDTSAGRLIEAERGFMKALAIHPSLANAWLGLSHVRLATRSLEGARRAVRMAVRLQPREPRIRIAAGDLYRSIGDRRAALREYESALRLETSGPDRLVALLALAGLHSDAGRPTTALHWLQQASTLAPDDPVVLEARARFYERHMPGSAATDSAWQALREVLPRHAEANLRCGQAESRGARLEDALASFEQAFMADPGLLVALYERGAAQAALGRLPEARGTLIDCIRRAGMPETRDAVIFEKARDLIQKIEERARDEGLMEDSDAR